MKDNTDLVEAFLEAQANKKARHPTRRAWQSARKLRYPRSKVISQREKVLTGIPTGDG